MAIKVLSIFGTRPEAIKMAPVVKELQSRPEFRSIVCVTAQHREMLDQVLTTFSIIPDYDLNIMKPGQTLAYITSEVLKGVEQVILKESPDIVLVHGDTTTAMAGALVSFYHQVKIGHVEAGLRTYNKYSPFPEEANRQIIDNIADLLFAPTEKSQENLKKSLNLNQKIFITGNTAIDALKTTISKNYSHPDLEWAKDSRLILLTSHRRENLGKPMEYIFTAIDQVTRNFKDVKVIFPVHLNPEIRELSQKILGINPRVKLISPLDVIDFHNFMNHAYLIASDSGGIQEEAPSLGKPVLVLRDNIERPEGVTAGTLKLIGTNSNDIYSGIGELLSNKKEYQRMAKSKNPYGDGFASKYIAEHILKIFRNHEEVNR